jgi:hypothetical protein
VLNRAVGSPFGDSYKYEGYYGGPPKG